MKAAYVWQKAAKKGTHVPLYFCYPNFLIAFLGFFSARGEFENTTKLFGNSP
jgi:hypothetical protein